MKFLNGIKSEWNVTLFHYRNYGSDFGKVLVGFLLPPDHDETEFELYLKELKYPYYEETDNPVFKQFLQ